jgi:hypothetical protein
METGMTPLKAFGLGVRILGIWLCLAALFGMIAFAAWLMWGAVGLAVYAGAWVVPTVTYWAYLMYRDEYLRGRA